MLRDGKPVVLARKAFAILTILVENSGRLVEKQRLMSEVWPDRFVEENNITVNISALRKALGEYEYIETIPGSGYRFAADVKVRQVESADTATQYPSTPRLSTEATTYLQNETISSLAILPLENATDDSDAEYLSDGITHSIINNLSRLRQLRVVAHSAVSHYKRKEFNPQEVGRHLRVQAVLIGGVLQIGNRMIIRTELIDVTGGWQIWGGEYNFDLTNIFVVQEEISLEISEKLRLRLTDEDQKRLAKPNIENVEAYQLYLKGRYYQNKQTIEDLKKGIEYYGQAIAKDPKLALGYAGLAECYALGGYPLDPDLGLAYAELAENIPSLIGPPKEAMSKAKTAAMKALELDNMLAEAHIALGIVRYFMDWDWLVAEKEYKRAIELSPNNPMAHFWYALNLRTLGQLDKSLAEFKLAQELDPLMLLIGLKIGRGFYFERQYDLAIEQYQKILEIEPSFLPVHLRLGQAYEQKGMYEEAIAEFQKIISILGENPQAMGALGHVYAVSGRKDLAQKVIDRFNEFLKKRYVATYDLAIIHLGLGDKEKALEYLEESCYDRSLRMIGIKVEPKLDSLRSEPRFIALLGRIGL